MRMVMHSTRQLTATASANLQPGIEMLGHVHTCTSQRLQSEKAYLDCKLGYDTGLDCVLGFSDTCSTSSNT